MNAARAPRGEAPLVLVVDDYLDGREACAEYLAFAGFRVSEAANGAEAMAKAFAEQPHVILMDLSLPDIDGWECMRRMRSDDRTRDTLIIAVTAHALDEYARTAREAGADSVITKPYLMPDLIAAIRRGLDGTPMHGSRGRAT
jgi:two-component system OmpR family response regulator